MSTTVINHVVRLVRTGRVIIAKYWEDCPRSERSHISIAHPGCAWAACGPTKRTTFSWWNVQMHSTWRQCCILTKFSFVVKSTCFCWGFLRVFCFFVCLFVCCCCFFFLGGGLGGGGFQALIWFFLSRRHNMKWIGAPASCEHKLDF